MIQVSKELLSAVLGEEVKSVELWKENSIRYFAPKDYIINIYELMHKMKEWAVEDKGFMFSKLINFGAYTQYQVSIKQPSVEAEFMGTTEFEAMTKACEWILKEQNEK